MERTTNPSVLVFPSEAAIAAAITATSSPSSVTSSTTGSATGAAAAGAGAAAAGAGACDTGRVGQRSPARQLPQGAGHLPQLQHRH